MEIAPLSHAACTVDTPDMNAKFVLLDSDTGARRSLLVQEKP